MLLTVEILHHLTAALPFFSVVVPMLKRENEGSKKSVYTAMQGLSINCMVSLRCFFFKYNVIVMIFGGLTTYGNTEESFYGSSVGPQDHGFRGILSYETWS